LIGLLTCSSVFSQTQGDKYGNIAQVWSAFEIRTEPDVSTTIRGLNSIQLHYEKGRWYIDSWTTQMESDVNVLVQDFLNDN